MRVTIVGREFPPAISGIGDHTDLLAAELVRLGHDVTVVCRAPGEQRETFTVLPVRSDFDARGGAELARTVASTRPDAIIWQYNPFSFGRRGLALGAGRFARALKAVAPLIVSAHELWFPWGRNRARGFLWAVSQRLQTRAVLRAAAHTVVTTDRRLGDLPRGLAASVIPIGANIEPGSSGSGREHLGIPDDAFVVAHFGSVGPGRDLGPVVDAVATLRERGIDARLLLAGNTGPFEHPASLNGSLIATGTGSRGEVSRVLASADVYVHPDRVGPAPGRRGSLAAALAHGLALVAYDGPDRDRRLESGRNCVLVGADAGDVTRALEALALDPGRRRLLGEALQQTYEQTFAWHRVGGAFDALLGALR